MTNTEALMRVLVACEFSGVVRDAFTAKGHEAVSCDLLPCDRPTGLHYQGDVFDLLDEDRDWDLMIAHPPCTYLTCSAEWLYRDTQAKKLKPGTLYGEARRRAREDAAEFFLRLAFAPVPRVAVENPVGVMSKRFRKPDQYIQPHEYGHDASKRTCLWLRGLPPLKPTRHVAPRYVNGLPRWGNQTDSGQNREPPADDRWKIRSVTWQGWADAMADQWGS
jgi:hypothetical protein